MCLHGSELERSAGVVGNSRSVIGRALSGCSIRVVVRLVDLFYRSG